MKRTQRLYFAVISSILLVAAMGLTSCSEEQDDPQANPPGVQDARTEPVDFRMNIDSVLDLESPVGDEGKDTVIFRQSDGTPTRNSIESAHIRFEIKGDRYGTLDHIFKDYGLYERVVDSTMPVPTEDRGANYPNYTLALTTPEFTGRYDYIKQYGWQMPMKYNPPYDSLEKAGVPLSVFELENSGAKKIGDTILNGYETAIYRRENPTVVETMWMWRGVPIRMHVFLPLDDLEFRMEPVLIDVNPTIPEGTFAFPKGLAIQKRESPPPPGMMPPPMPGPPPPIDTGKK